MVSSEPNGSAEVEEFLRKLEHPLKETVTEARCIVLNAHPGIAELVKWNAPSFRYLGEDRITFNLGGKGLFRIIFHNGVKKRRDNGKFIADAEGRLSWPANDRAVVEFRSAHELKNAIPWLQKTVKHWLLTPLPEEL